MFKRWKSFLARHLSAPEESTAYRTAVTALVMFCLIITLHQLEWPSYWWVVLTLTPAASYLSYKRRAQANLEIKIALSLAMIYLLFWFLLRLSQSLYDPRIPLAELLIWLQCLHAFDLPAKKDLRYTALVALILMAIAAVLTYSSYFGLLVIIFCALSLITAALDLWSSNRTKDTLEITSKHPPRRLHNLSYKWLLSTLSVSLPVAFFVAFMIFALMPKFKGLSVRALPFSPALNLNLSKLSQGEIVNPGLGQASQLPSGKPQKFSGDSYFGFNSEVNLNARGRPSERILLKVRTSDWLYHRAATYTYYNGAGWISGLAKPHLKTISHQPFHFNLSSAQGKEAVTIYYVERDLPNLIFTPPDPKALFFPSNDIYVIDTLANKKRAGDSTPATLISPFALESGAVYSVLSNKPTVTAKELLNLPSPSLNKLLKSRMAAYLQLPRTVPARVKEKAEQLTITQSSAWGKATALCAYLQQNYTYNAEVPFYPEEVDTADYFLFKAKEGYCEQFATALCILARSVGLPARYATGYLPGTYNPLSGFYEIKGSDAHAWAEIYIPQAGWIIFDPVPGGDPTPVLSNIEQNGWLLEYLASYLKIPKEYAAWLPKALRAIALVLVIYLVLALKLKIKVSKRKTPEGELRLCLAKAERLLEPRKAGETVKTWAVRLKDKDLQKLAELYELTFYQDRFLSLEQKQILKEISSSLGKTKGSY